MCKPPRLPIEKFALLNHLPNPVMASDGHYKNFNDVFGTNTAEEQRPSLEKITKKRLPFYPSVQHVNNVKTMLMCDECGMWRLAYATKKLRFESCVQHLMIYHFLVVLVCRKQTQYLQ